jgi:hypothetical protein
MCQTDEGFRCLRKIERIRREVPSRMHITVMQILRDRSLEGETVEWGEWVRASETQVDGLKWNSGGFCEGVVIC